MSSAVNTPALTQAEAERAAPAAPDSGRSFWLGRMAVAALAVMGSLLSTTGSAQTSAYLKTLFVEAEGEVEIRSLKGTPYPVDTGYWINNQRIIYTVREWGGWKAQKDERSKIVIVDVDTGAVEETPYRGNLKCLSPDGDILVQDYPVPTPNSDFRLPGDGKDDSQVYLAGKVGDKELTRFKRPKETGILDTYACRFYNNRAHDFGASYMQHRLRHHDGFIYAMPFDLSHVDNKLYMVSLEGKTLWSREVDRCTYGDQQYLPWLRRYFKSATWGGVVQGCMNPNKNSWLFSADGAEVKPLPPLIQELRKAKRTGANGSTYWARRGMYVFVQYSRPEDLDGLYRVDEASGQLKRVLKKSIRLDHISPDGCRNLVMTTPPTIIELCKGEQQ